MHALPVAERPRAAASESTPFLFSTRQNPKSVQPRCLRGGGAHLSDGNAGVADGDRKLVAHLRGQKSRQVHPAGELKYIQTGVMVVAMTRGATHGGLLATSTPTSTSTAAGAGAASLNLQHATNPGFCFVQVPFGGTGLSASAVFCFPTFRPYLGPTRRRALTGGKGRRFYCHD